MSYPMRLQLLASTSDEYLPVLTEGYGRVYYFHYLRWKHDPRPRALFLGRYRHPNTKNVLMCGINLNYLSENEMVRLQRILHQVLSFSRNGYYRYWRARDLGIGNILDKAYRTYRADAIDSIEGISPSTLRFIAEGIQEERARGQVKRKPLKPRVTKVRKRPEAEFIPEKPEEVPEKPEEVPEKPEEVPEEIPEKPEEVPEKPEEELPPEIEKAEIPPEHPDEEIDIEKYPPEKSKKEPEEEEEAEEE